MIRRLPGKPAPAGAAPEARPLRHGRSNIAPPRNRTILAPLNLILP